MLANIVYIGENIAQSANNITIKAEPEITCYNDSCIVY